MLLHFIGTPGSAIHNALESRMKEGHPNLEITSKLLLSTFYSIQEKEKERLESNKKLPVNKVNNATCSFRTNFK